MTEFLWFLMGALLCQLFTKFLNLRDKALFIRDIKIIAFQLIGMALKDLLIIRKTKYAFLKEHGTNEEKLKIHYNEDNMFFNEWKKKIVLNLNLAVPPIYHEVLNVKTWDDILTNLDIYYKGTIADSASSVEELEKTLEE